MTKIRICTKCGKTRTDKQRTGLCASCLAKRRRERNPEAYRLKEKRRRSNPVRYFRILARNALFRALKRGAVTRHPCEICGDPRVDGHHDDHSKRLEVRWLCQQHHLELHKLDQIQ